MLQATSVKTAQTTLQRPALNSFTMGFVGLSSDPDILQLVGQTILSTPANIWAALDLNQYFGFNASTLYFKEMLVPFVWVARQQLIDRAGEDFVELPGAVRQKVERELLITLDTFCIQRVQGSHPKASKDELRTLAEEYRQQGWQEFCREYPLIATELAEKLVHWINTTSGFLSLMD